MFDVVRGSFAMLSCAIMTCSSGTPHTEEFVVHAPVDDIVTPTTPPPAPLASDLGAPFWKQGPTGHAVPILRADASNMRYAAMNQAACEADLVRRGVPFVRAEPTPGVLAPVRLRGPLSAGVTIHSQLRDVDRDRSPMEIFDCRLVLALDDFSVVLHEHGIVDVVHLSAFRSRKNFGCTPKYDGKQHCGALAVDLATFKRADGSSLDVLRDFHGRVGAPTCVSPKNAMGEIERIVCEAADRATFNVILTPNFNAQHVNHVHVEITPDAAWMLVH